MRKRHQDTHEITEIHSRALHYWLNKKGWTQRELADLVYVSRHQVSRWALGKAPISEYRVCLIAVALGITPREFLAAGQKTG